MAEVDGTEGGSGRRWQSRWAKALLAAGLTLLAVGIGIRLKPPKPLARDLVQPTITIFASQPGVSAVVAMSAFPYPGSTATPSTGTGTNGTPAPSAPGYELDITLKVLSPQVLTPRASGVWFMLVLGDFPRIYSTGISGLTASPEVPPPSALSEVLPVPGQDAAGYADYVAFREFLPPPPAAAPTRRPSEPTVKIATLYSLVSRSSGSELQVAFPVVLDEKSASSPPPRHSFQLSSLLGGYQNWSAAIAGVPAGYYEPSLEAGDNQYRPGDGTNLADYQTLAGTTPVIRPAGAWSWAGISDVSVLTQDALTADVDQEHLFWDGVAWGVVGAGGIAAVLEFVSALQGELARRARARASKSPEMVADPAAG